MLEFLPLINKHLPIIVQELVNLKKQIICSYLPFLLHLEVEIDVDVDGLSCLPG